VDKKLTTFGIPLVYWHLAVDKYIVENSKAQPQGCGKHPLKTEQPAVSDGLFLR
jgi:hypothetical protein